MAISLPPIPAQLPASVKRFNADGTPTTAQVVYETQLQAALKAIAAAVALV